MSPGTFGLGTQSNEREEASSKTLLLGSYTANPEGQHTAGSGPKKLGGDPRISPKEKKQKKKQKNTFEREMQQNIFSDTHSQLLCVERAQRTRRIMSIERDFLS